ncbi:MAG: hypothetical protein JWQ71_3767 [Pedosphaera sp.]|nr:hypothetical protein [Pedosphaera sp.]
MTKPEIPINLIRWNVPFADKCYPSVSLITEQGGNVVVLVIAPDGIDKYPKYIVRAERVTAVLCYQEAFAPDRGCRASTRREDRTCAYQWIDSPWLQSYRDGEEIFMWGSLLHYVILGGDSIVEFIAPGEPTIERIDSSTILETKLKV